MKPTLFNGEMKQEPPAGNEADVCEFQNCIYWGKKDESGSLCDGNQIKVCKEIRGRAAAKKIKEEQREKTDK